jgi:hypothetical protein
MTRTYVITRVVLRSCILCGEPEWAAEWNQAEKTERPQRELTYAEAVADRNARCARCGGSLANEMDVRRVRLEPEIDWYADRPRRGRPSKIMQALRLRLNTDPKVNA